MNAYHGTSADFAESILEYGIIPYSEIKQSAWELREFGLPVPDWKSNARPGCTYFMDTYEAAYIWACRWSDHPVVVLVELDSVRVNSDTSHPHAPRGALEYSGAVEPDAILHVYGLNSLPG